MIQPSPVLAAICLRYEGNARIDADDTQTNSRDFVYVSGLAGFGTGVDTAADFTPGPGGDVAVILGARGLTSFAQLQANMTDSAFIPSSACRLRTGSICTMSTRSSSPRTICCSFRAIPSGFNRLPTVTAA